MKSVLTTMYNNTYYYKTLKEAAGWKFSINWCISWLNVFILSRRKTVGKTITPFFGFYFYIASSTLKKNGDNYESKLELFINHSDGNIHDQLFIEAVNGGW